MPAMGLDRSIHQSLVQTPNAFDQELLLLVEPRSGLNVIKFDPAFLS